jgi:hypothetical protein
MKNLKKIGSILLVLALVCGLSVGVFAAGVTTGISGSTSVTVGQSLTVNVIFRGSGVNIGSLGAAITYDASKLTCTSISSSAITSDTGGRVIVSYANIDGTSSLQVSLNFTAKAAGSASVQASISDCTDQDANPIGSYSGASANVSISNPVAPPPQSSSRPSASQSSRPSTSQSSRPSSSRPSSSQSSSSEPVVDEPQVMPLTVTVDGKTMQISPSLIGIEVPEGFEIGQDEYKGQAVDVARSTAQDILLMYLTDADGNGGFYRFNRAADTFSPFYRLTVSASRYTVMDLPEGVRVPSGWTPITFEYGAQLIPGYKQADVEQGLWLIYASNDKGDTGFYLYDPLEGTVQRYVQLADLPAGNPGGMNGQKGTFFERMLADRDMFFTVIVSWAMIVLIAGAWLVTHFARKKAHVSDKKRKKKEEKVTKKLEKRAARASKKSKIKAQPLEIEALEEIPAENEEAAEEPEIMSDPSAETADEPEATEETANEPEATEISAEEESE